MAKDVKSTLKPRVSAIAMRVPDLLRSKRQSQRSAMGLWPVISFSLWCLVLSPQLCSVAHAQYAGHVSRLVIDAKTGEVLSDYDADLQRYPASLTKLMTLYLTFRSLRAGSISLESEMPVSIHAAMQAPSKLGLRPGSRFTMEQAIFGLVTKSANDAACVLGEYLAGGNEGHFATLMTRQARALGMSQTTFRNASGLPDPDQVSTARDLSILARHLINDFPEYYHYFSTPEFRFHGHRILNHNQMLKTYAGADGMKTGYTSAAGHNLVTSAQQNGVRLVGVVLGARSNVQRNMIMKTLLDHGFEAKGLAPLPPRTPLVLASHRYVRAHRGHSNRRSVLEVAQMSNERRRYQLVRKNVSHHRSASGKYHVTPSRYVGKSKRRHAHHKG